MARYSGPARLDLTLSAGLAVRPIANGCLVVVGNRGIEELDPRGEAVLALCQRQTPRIEIVSLLTETFGSETSEIDKTIDRLLAAHLLTAS